MAAPKKGVSTRRPAPPKRRTKEEIETEEGWLCDETYLRVAALKHRWDQLQNTVFKTGRADLHNGESIPLNTERASEIRALAARWGMEVGITRSQLSLPWTITFTRKDDWEKYPLGKIAPPEPVTQVTEASAAPSLSVPDGQDPRPGGLYERIDQHLAAILEQTDAILDGIEDRRSRPAVGREIYRRVGNAGQAVMDRVAACQKDLEGHP